MFFRGAARALALAALVAVPALAACTKGGHPSASASPSAMSDAQILAIGKELAQCIREHGVPGLPDPTVDNGRLILPDGVTENIPKDQAEAALAACRDIMNRLPPSALGDSGDDQQNQTPLSAEDLAKARRWAQCVRDHGLTDFPDPDQYGVIDLTGTSLATEGKSERMRNAFDACQQYSVPNTSITGHRA